MTAPSIVRFSLVYLLLTVVGLAIAAFAIRANHQDEGARGFQNAAALAGQYAQTFQTMDGGLRKKSAQALAALAGGDRRVIALDVFDGDNQRIFGSAPGAAPNQRLLSQAWESPVGGRHRIFYSYCVFAVEDVNLLIVVACAALIGLMLFLVAFLLLSGDARPSSAGMPATAPDMAAETGPQPAAPTPEAIVGGSEPPVFDEPAAAVSAVKKPSASEDSRYAILDRDSGVTREAFLEFRLTKELERSAENAVDMCMALFRFARLSPAEHANAAGLLLADFSHEDLIFEMGPNTFCVLLPQHDLDQAIARAELFIRKAEEKLLRTGQPITVLAGLSARNGRLIDAKRFIKEAQLAVNKANLREGRIVGFRPDPARFRNYLRHHKM